MPGHWHSFFRHCRRTHWRPSDVRCRKHAVPQFVSGFCCPLFVSSTDIHTTVARTCTLLLKLANKGEVCYLLFQTSVSWPVRSGEATVAMVGLRRKHHRFWTKSERWLQTDGMPWQGADCLDSDGSCTGDQMISESTETVGWRACRSREWVYRSAKRRITNTQRCGQPAIC